MRARPATPDDIQAICRLCAQGRPGPRAQARSESFYTPGRVARELDADPPCWGGWFVAEAEVVVAAGAGGMTGAETGGVFVLTAAAERRGEGAGSALLRAITAQQVELGATGQWVVVGAANTEGIRFYEAQGFVRRGTQRACGLDGASAHYWRSLSRQRSGNPRRSG